jgi:phage terminase large subunit-like protein
MARGISDFVDTMTLRRENGKSAIIRLKTFEQDRTAWQGEAVDEIVLDEDSGDDVIYGEALARLAATSGRILVSMTPVLGRTPIRKRFIERLGHGCAEIVMGLQDADHIPKEQHAEILARYKASERATRAYGSDMQGEGAVFEIPESEIVHTRDPAQVPSYWRWLWGLDFSHGGMSAQAHPFAAVLGVHDIDSDCIYIMHALRMRQALPIQHVHALKQHPAWEAPCAWPHDGQMTGFGNTVTFSQTYRNLGLHMRPTFATFKDGGFSLENGIAEMEQRFATGRLKVAAHLGEWLDEFRNYHRDGGLVVKADDDLLSATRQLVMDIRYAKSLTQDRHGDFRRQERRELYASGIDFPLT